jgi:hypothetical protein
MVTSSRRESVPAVGTEEQVRSARHVDKLWTAIPDRKESPPHYRLLYKGRCERRIHVESGQIEMSIDGGLELSRVDVPFEVAAASALLWER